MYSKGTSVYVGYTPDCMTHPAACPYRCRVGTIQAGPFSPDQRGRKRGTILSGPWYHVIIDGKEFDAAERILFPFHDPDTETETTEQGEVAV